ncbi:AAA family ATPase [Dictyobacter kobayashii]|nr:ATP-binding protein [Dictyobacter kobayashii]
MLVKVFVLGRPGSGKTTAIHHLLNLAQQRDYSAFSIDDYSILYRMSRDERYHEQFRRTAYDGFDVLDLSVFDTALQNLEQQVQAMSAHASNGIITIEFARNDYAQALSQFSADFLKDAYIFFVDADLETCIERIYQRVASPRTQSGHFVSDYIMHTYYSYDNWSYVSTQLMSVYHIYKMAQTFRNTGSVSHLLAQVERFAEHIFLNEFKQLASADQLKQLAHA